MKRSPPARPTAVRPRDTNKSATALRAFRVLETVAESSEPLPVNEISRRTGLDRTTCYRMLKTIEEAGYLIREHNTKNFRLSWRLLTVAKQLLVEDEDRAFISRVLKRISALTGETCHYSEIDMDSTVLTQRSKGVQLVAVDFRIGDRCPLHATSVGKAILAFQDPDFVHAYVQRPLARFTENTIVDPERLTRELESIRATGISYDRYELSLGMKCVAVPVRGREGIVHSGISISGPDSRFTDQKLVELGMTIATEIESALEASTAHGSSAGRQEPPLTRRRAY